MADHFPTEWELHSGWYPKVVYLEDLVITAAPVLAVTVPIVLNNGVTFTHEVRKQRVWCRTVGGSFDVPLPDISLVKNYELWLYKIGTPDLTITPVVGQTINGATGVKCA